MIKCDYCNDPSYDLDGKGYHTLFDEELGGEQMIPCGYVFSDVLCEYFHDATCIHDSYSIECLAKAISLRNFIGSKGYQVLAGIDIGKDESVSVEALVSAQAAPPVVIGKPYHDWKDAAVRAALRDIHRVCICGHPLIRHSEYGCWDCGTAEASTPQHNFSNSWRAWSREHADEQQAAEDEADARKYRSPEQVDEYVGEAVRAALEGLRAEVAAMSYTHYRKDGAVVAALGEVVTAIKRRLAALDDK